MRRFLFAVFLVVACATVVAADAIEDAESTYNRGDYIKAARLLRPLADQGNARAQFNLGVMYERGQGVPQFDTEAVQWYRKAVVLPPPVQTVARKKLVAFIGCQDYTVLEDVLEPGDYDVSFVTSLESAYSEIVGALPDRIVLCMRADDERSLQVLSMLHLDVRTHHIPVTTCVAGVDGKPDECTDGEEVSWLAPTRPGIVLH